MPKYKVTIEALVTAVDKDQATTALLNGDNDLVDALWVIKSEEITTLTIEEDTEEI